MNIGIESKALKERLQEKYVYIDNFYLKNGMRRTIKEITKKYGYSISASAKLFHDVVG